METRLKKSRFTEPQILAMLKQGESGISNAAYYNWRSKYGGMDASLMSEMKAMADGEPLSAIGSRIMASDFTCVSIWAGFVCVAFVIDSFLT
jgi:putative transposase